MEDQTSTKFPAERLILSKITTGMKNSNVPGCEDFMKRLFERKLELSFICKGLAGCY